MAEIVERRTLYSKTYETGRNAYRCVIRNRPVHYHDGSGLQDIDLMPRAELDHYVFDKSRHVLRVGAGNLPIYRYTEPNTQVVEVELLATPYRYTIEGNEFKWQIASNAYYTLTPLGTGCASKIWLADDAAPRIWQWRVQGNPDLLRPISGHDSKHQALELLTSWADDILTVEWTGRVTNMKMLRKAKKIVWKDRANYPVVIDPTVNRSPTVAYDDVVSLWRNNGATYSYMDGYTTDIGPGMWITDYINYVGVRFQDITIPVGATINTAYLKVRGTGARANINLRIYGSAVDSAAEWGSSNRVKEITKTSAFCPITSFNTAADNTFDVKTIVEELVGRGGWASGNNIGFGFFKNGTTESNGIFFASLEQATLAEPRIEIDYSESGAGVVGPGAGLTRSILLRPRRLVN